MFVELIDYKNKANMLDKLGQKVSADKYDALIRRMAKFVSNIHRYDLDSELTRRLICAKNIYLKNIRKAAIDGMPQLKDFDEKFDLQLGEKEINDLQLRVSGQNTDSQVINELTSDQASDIFQFIQNNPNAFPKMPLDLFSQLVKKHAGQEVDDMFINNLEPEMVEYELTDRLSGMAVDLKANVMSQGRKVGQDIDESTAMGVVHQLISQTLRSIKNKQDEHPLYQNIENGNHLELMKHFVGNIASKIQYGVRQEKNVQKNVNPLSKVERIIFGSATGAAKLKSAIFQVMELLGTSDPYASEVEEYVMANWDFSQSPLSDDETDIVSPNISEDLYRSSSSIKSAIAEAKRLEEQSCRRNPEECNPILMNNNVDQLLEIFNNGYPDSEGAVQNIGMLLRFGVYQAAQARSKKEAAVLREFVRANNSGDEQSIQRSIQALAKVAPPVNLEFNNKGEIGLKYSGNQDSRNNKVDAIRNICYELHENGNTEASKNYAAGVAYAIAVKQISAAGGMQSLQERGSDSEDARELGDRIAMPEQSISIDQIMNEAAVGGNNNNAVNTVARVALESYILNKPLDAGKLSARRNKDIFINIFSDLISGDIEHEEEHFEARLTKVTLPKVIEWIESKYGKLKAGEESGRRTIIEKGESPEKEFVKNMLFDDEFDRNMEEVIAFHRGKKSGEVPAALSQFDSAGDKKFFTALERGIRVAHYDFQKFLMYLSFGLGIPEKNLAHLAFANDPHTKLNAAKNSNQIYCKLNPDICSENADLMKIIFSQYNSPQKGSYITRLNSVSNDDDNMDVDTAMYFALKYVAHSRANKKARNVNIRAMELDDDAWAADVNEETKKKVAESFYFMRFRNLLKAVELDGLTHHELEQISNIVPREDDTKAHPSIYLRNSCEAYEKAYNRIVSNYTRKLSQLISKYGDNTSNPEFIRKKGQFLQAFQMDMKRLPGTLSNTVVAEKFENDIISNAVTVNDKSRASGIDVDEMNFAPTTFENCVSQYNQYLREIVSRLKNKISDYGIEGNNSPEHKMLSEFEKELEEHNIFIQSYSGATYQRERIDDPNISTVANELSEKVGDINFEEIEAINDPEIIEDRFLLSDEESDGEEEPDISNQNLIAPQPERPSGIPEISVPNNAIFTDRDISPQDSGISSLSPADYAFVQNLYSLWTSTGRSSIPESQKSRAESLGIQLKPKYRSVGDGMELMGYNVVGFSSDLISEMTRQAHFNKYRKMIVFSKKEIKRILDRYGV